MQYQIFLSYSHRDADLLGTEYIWELKRQIEDSVGMKDSVFLDVDALNLGVDWNKTINECLDCSKVFICLLSSNYIDSEYCRRERLWWENKEMRNGMLSRNTLPIYFIEVPEEKRTQSTAEWILQTNARPWFEQGVPETLQKEVKQRLADAAQRERNVRELLRQKDSEGKTVLATIHTMKERYELGAESFSSVPCYNLDFVGRIKELSEIRSICIKRHGGQDIPVIYGPAGCGKSDLAFAYANGYAADYPGGRFLINMATCHDWKSALCQMVTSYSGKSKETQVSTSVCKELLGFKLEEFNKQDEEKRYQAVCAALERRCKEKPVLIVLDNVVDQDLFRNDNLSQLFEHGIPNNLDIIATTRQRPEGLPLFNVNLEKGSFAVAYYLGNLDEVSALELFRKHCIFAEFNTNPPDGVENDTSETVRTETQAARKIVRLLDCHAWSICHIAGAFSECYKRIEPPNIEGEDPLELGDKTCEQLFQELQAYFAADLTNNGHLQSVKIEEYANKVMALTVEQISELPLGKDILNFASIITLFAPDFIPLRLLEVFYLHLNAENNMASWSTIRDTLLRHHILSGPKAKICRMHRLTWKFFREYGNSDECCVNLNEIAKLFADFIKEFVLTNALSQHEAAALIHLGESWCNTSWAEDNYHFLLDIIPTEGCKHFLIPELTEYRKVCQTKFETKDNKKFLQTALLYDFDGCFFYLNGDYSSACCIFEKSLRIKLKRLDADHPDIATTYCNMAGVYSAQGEYDKALELYENCLIIRKKRLDADHPDIATIYHNMAWVYRAQGEYDKALEFYEACLAIEQKRLGEDHPSIATTYCNMAGVYSNQGKYDKALELYENCLTIQKKHLDADHPDIATTYHNMAWVYRAQGEYDKALEFYENCLTIQKKRLDDDHPDIATTYNNMAVVYIYQGKYETALEYCQNSLEIRRKYPQLAPLDIATNYYNIASIYDLKGEYEAALEYYKNAYEIYCPSLGENHPRSQTCLSEIHMIYKKLRRWGWWLKIKRWFNKKKDVE